MAAQCSHPGIRTGCGQLTARLQCVRTCPVLMPVSLPSFDTQQPTGDLATAERLFTRAMRQLQWQVHEDGNAEHVDDCMLRLQQVMRWCAENNLSGRKEETLHLFRPNQG